MKRYEKPQIVITTVLAVSCIGLILQGCAAEGKKADGLGFSTLVTK